MATQEGLGVVTVARARTYSYYPRPLRYTPTSMPWLQLTLLFLAVIKSLPMEVCCNRLPDVYWNSSNPIFRIDNTDHIIDVNQGNLPFEYDQVNIICPVYSSDVSKYDAESYIVYNVNKEEYDSCRITEPNPQQIAICNKPYKLMYFTITFRSFTPQPGGLEFKPGQDYYFISTSSKDDLYQNIGGHCNTHHMKLVFKVCCDPESKPSHDQAGQHVNNELSTPRGTSTITTTTIKTSTTITTPKSTTTTLPTSHTKDPRKTDLQGRDNNDEEMKNKKLALNGSSRSVSEPSIELYIISTLFLSTQISSITLLQTFRLTLIENYLNLILK